MPQRLWRTEGAGMRVGRFVLTMTLGTAGIGLATVVDGETRPAVLLVAAILAASTALVREIVRSTRGETPVAIDDRPPDGLVPLVPIDGLVAEPNSHRGDCKAYRALRDAAIAPARPG